MRILTESGTPSQVCCENVVCMCKHSVCLSVCIMSSPVNQEYVLIAWPHVKSIWLFSVCAN